MTDEELAALIGPGLMAALQRFEADDVRQMRDAMSATAMRVLKDGDHDAVQTRLLDAVAPILAAVFEESFPEAAVSELIGDGAWHAPDGLLLH